MYLSLKTGDIIFKYCYPLYKILYPAFKRRQDKQEIEFLKSIIKPGYVIIDIGANIGFYAKMMAEWVGEQGTLHCFEPDPVNFSKLQEEVGNRKNVKLYQKAVAEQKGSLSFYLSHRLNVDHRSYKPEKYDKEIQVEAVRMDELFGDTVKPNIIKIDIQGFEMSAFRGMTNILNSNLDLIIISEFWPYGLKAAGESTMAFQAFFDKMGFHIYLMEENFRKLSPQLASELADMPEKFYRNVLISKQFNPNK